MHVGDTIFIFCLALILFGPKKLPEIGRQIGKLMVEFRRASNEFKLQIEEELRASEEAERQKEIDAAKVMLPNAGAAATASLPAVSATETSEAGASTIPVISPPVTGLPVNHSFGNRFGSAEDVATSETASANGHSTEFAESSDAIGAYPESANGFNPGLNTASNGLIAEGPLSETVEPAAGKTEAPAHHG
jgi:sec-independent protein translocase protein TatB